jgi:hypothetical protein
VYSALRTRRNKQYKPLHISRSAFRGATAPLWTTKTTTRTAKAVLPQRQAHLRLPPRADETANETTNEATKEMSNETSNETPNETPSQTAIEAMKETATEPAASPNRRRTARGAMTRDRSRIAERARRTHAGIGATGAAAAVATDSSGTDAGIAAIADADVAAEAEVPVALAAAIVDGRIAKVAEEEARRARWTRRRDNSRAASVRRSR